MTWNARYSDDQREAMAVAYIDRGASAKLVVDLAARGELEVYGRRLEPFETNESTVRSVAGKVRRRRFGEVKSTLAAMPANDANETLRRRLMSAADVLLSDYERHLKRRPGETDPERLRQIVLVAREAAALPGPNDPRPPAPGVSVNGRRTEGATRGGLGDQILKAARGSVDPEPPAGEPGPEAPAEPPEPEFVTDLRRDLAEIARSQEQALADGRVNGSAPGDGSARSDEP
jgi:hypothetical protein